MTLFELTRENERIGLGGIERVNGGGLLRSIVIKQKFRGKGYGEQLTLDLIQQAREDGVKHLYLLTTTADSLFETVGFRRIERSEAPPAVRNTEEFQSFCSDTAVHMKRTTDNS